MACDAIVCSCQSCCCLQDSVWASSKLLARRPSSVEQFCVMQAPAMIPSLLHLLLQKLQRIVDQGLCTPLCLLFLASTRVLQTLQAAAFLTSLALPHAVCSWWMRERVCVHFRCIIPSGISTVGRQHCGKEQCLHCMDNRQSTAKRMHVYMQE